VKRGRAQVLAPVNEKRRQNGVYSFLLSITGKSFAMHAGVEKDKVRYPLEPLKVQ